MKKLWAPWRLEYIVNDLMNPKKKKKGCIFCAAAQAKADAKSLVLFRGTHAYVIMNKYPYTNAHLMVIPNRHVGEFTQLTGAEHEEMGRLLSFSVAVLKKKLRAQGFNIGMNLGKAGGAGIREHVHYHILPRWVGDHNFMPLVGGVRVMLEYLQETYAKLKREFEQFS